MDILKSRQQLFDWRAQQSGLAFVPTMGNLHAGHLSLVNQARDLGKSVLVSIYVNPIQFEPGEDLEKYPRTFKADCEKLQGLADAVWAPQAGDVWHPGEEPQPWPTPMAKLLCGEFRPNHFDGVTAVVRQLFKLTQPDDAIFGQKDFQQMRILEEMVKALDIPVTMHQGALVREDSGVALSSRNQYLSAAERATAAQIYGQLSKIKDLWLQGGALMDLCQASWDNLEALGFKLDYLHPVAWDSLEKVREVRERTVVCVAAHLGSTRLIDNLILEARPDVA